MSATNVLSSYARLVLFRRVCVVQEDFPLGSAASQSALQHRRISRVRCAFRRVLRALPGQQYPLPGYPPAPYMYSFAYLS